MSIDLCGCGECKSYKIHKSDCAVHNRPGFEKKPCSCGAEHRCHFCNGDLSGESTDEVIAHLRTCGMKP